MPLIYTLISRQTHILTEYALPNIGGNYMQITNTLLKKITKQPHPTADAHSLDDENSAVRSQLLGNSSATNSTPGSLVRQSYVYDNYIYHYTYTPEDTLIYLCLTDRNYNTPTAYSFLDELRQQFTSLYKPYAIAVASAYSLATYDDEISRLMQRYNTEYGSSGDKKLHQINAQLTSVKDVMVTNIDSVLERGEKIELLVDKSDMLSSESVKFKKSSQRLKYKKMFDAARWYMILALVLLAVVYVGLAFGCGGVSLPNCRG